MGHRFDVARVKQHERNVGPQQELAAGTAYLLVLYEATPEGSYTLFSSYQRIPEATEESLQPVRKALFGTEGEPFAQDALAVPDAAARGAVLANRLARDLAAFAQRTDADCLDYIGLADADRRDEPDDPFRGVADPRVVLAEIDGRWSLAGGGDSYEGNGDLAFSPLLLRRQDGWKKTGGDIPPSAPAEVRDGCKAWVTELAVQGAPVGRVLLVQREAATPRGAFTVRVYLKLDAGPHGFCAPRGK